MSTLHGRIMRVATAAALVATTMPGVCQVAYAAPTVSGADYYGNGEIAAGASVEVLHVTGYSNETLYLKVQQDGSTIADRVSYNMSQDSEGGSTSSGTDRMGVVRLNIDGFDLSDSTYTVTAYSDRAETNQLFNGKIYGVYAQLDGGTMKLIGTHVAENKPSRLKSPTASLYFDDKTYAYDGKDAIVNNNATGGASIVYGYDEYSEADCSTGTISYVTTDGTVLSTTTVAGIANGGSKTVNLPKVVTATGEDGTTQMYRVVTSKTSVTFTNPGQMSFSFQVRWIGSSKDMSQEGNNYLATIKMVDEDGSAVITDTVSVTGTFTYTLPATIYKKVGDVVYTYTLADADNAVLTLKTTDSGVSGHAKTIEVKYKAQAGTPSSTTVHFNYIDGTNQDLSSAARKIGSKDVTVSSKNKTATPDATVTANGTTYKIAGTASKYAYTFGDSAYPVANVYYVPEGYTPSNGSYEVKVNYVNFLTKETIKTETFTSSESDTEDYQFTSAKTFSQNGVDYVRLDGQEEGISHSYYSGTKTYTVYYRDKNDTYTSGTVINKVRVVYTPGTTTTTTTTMGGTTGSTTSTASNDNSTTGALNGDGTYNSLDGDGNDSTLTNEEGVDSNTERIDDNETPLASGTQNNDQALPVWAGVAAAVVVVAAAGGLALYLKRRKSNNGQNA